MENLIQYIIDLSLCWTLFLSIYVIFLQRETFFNYNRWYLMSTLLAGLALPLLRFVPDVFKVEAEGQIIYQYVAQGTTAVAHSISDSTNIWSSFGILLIGVYLLGVAFFTFLFVKGILGIKRLEQGADIIHHADYTLVQSEEAHLPFSFFRKVYMSKNVDFTQDVSQIMKHELAHVSGWHSVDIVLVEMLKILIWFHPLVYLYKSALRQAHEFVADQLVCQEYKRSDYGRMLIQHSFSGLQMSLANHFFNAHLKKRIQMMYQNPSNKKASLKYLIAMPFVAAIIMAFITIAPGCGPSVEVVNESNSGVESSITWDQIDTIVDFNPETMEEKMVMVKTKNKPSKELIKSINLNSVDTLVDYNPNTLEENFFTITHKLNEGKLVMIQESVANQAPLKNHIPEETYKVVDEMPRFPGCENVEASKRQDCANSKMMTFLFEHIKYPVEARKNNIEGMVVLQFVVKKDGSIEDIKSVKEVSHGCTEEAIKVVELMNEMSSKWTPGKQNGKPVNVQFTLPIKFKLTGE